MYICSSTSCKKSCLKTENSLKRIFKNQAIGPFFKWEGKKHDCYKVLKWINDADGSKRKVRKKADQNWTFCYGMVQRLFFVFIGYYWLLFVRLVIFILFVFLWWKGVRFCSFIFFIGVNHTEKRSTWIGGCIVVVK